MDKIFNKPFAINGARVTIPENGTENERVSFDKGFTQPYEVEAPSVDNPNGQGFNILRPEMNEALYQLSSACNILAENIDKWTALTTENLNDIKQAGRYFQNSNKNATNERNYPENIAGYLIVLNNSINSYGVTQIYKIWNSEKIYIRKTTSATAWSNWDSLVLTSEFNNKITSLQNTDTNLNNNKEDKTKITFERIPDGANLNNYTTQGFYCLQSIANVGENFPERNAGYLFVFKRGGTDNYYQIYYLYNSTAIYIRNSESGSWTSWKKIALWNNTEATYRKIADSYTKSEVNTRTPSLVLSKIGFEYSNIQNATFTIPNNSFLKTCNIQIMFRIRQQANNEITFNFKNGNVIVASRKFTRSSVSRQDFDVCDYISGLASFNITSALLGKTITPEIVATNTGALFLIHEVDLLITYGS